MLLFFSLPRLPFSLSFTQQASRHQIFRHSERAKWIEMENVVKASLSPYIQINLAMYCSAVAAVSYKIVNQITNSFLQPALFKGTRTLKACNSNEFKLLFICFNKFCLVTWRQQRKKLFKTLNCQNWFNFWPVRRFHVVSYQCSFIDSNANAKWCAKNSIYPPHPL